VTQPAGPPATVGTQPETAYAVNQMVGQHLRQFLGVKNTINQDRDWLQAATLTETIAYFRIEGVEAEEIGERPVELSGALAARLDPRTGAAPGEPIELAVDLESAQFFDVASGESLLSRE